MTQEALVRRGEGAPLAIPGFVKALGRRLDSLSRIHGYIPALIALGISIALILLFRLTFGPKFIGVGFVYIAFMIIASWCGYGPGIIGVLAISVGVPFLFTPGFSLAKVSPAGIGMVVLLSTMVSRGAANRRHAEDRLRQMNEELERRVREQTAELARANAALEHQITELRRANSDLEQFAYSASHDLREPLRTVSLAIQLLKKQYRGKLDEGADSWIDHAVAGTAQMDALIRDLRSYITISMDEEQEPGIADAQKALERALTALTSPITDNHAIVEHTSLPVVEMGPVHLEQVFQNLISNAIKYRSKNVPHIQVSCKKQNGSWRFAVRDNGIGIEHAYSTKIFGLFKRLHTGSEYEGTGMGLAICQKIIQRYEGRIWVESAVGEGSTFYFEVPIRQVTSINGRAIAADC